MEGKNDHEQDREQSIRFCGCRCACKPPDERQRPPSTDRDPVEGTQSPGALFSYHLAIMGESRMPKAPDPSQTAQDQGHQCNDHPPRKDGQEPPYHPEASGKPPPVGSRPGYPMPLTSPSASGPRKDASEVIMGGRGQIRKENAKLSGKTRTSPSWKQPGWSPGPWRRVKAPEAPPGPARHPGQPPAWSGTPAPVQGHHCQEADQSEYGGGACQGGQVDPGLQPTVRYAVQDESVRTHAGALTNDHHPDKNDHETDDRQEENRYDTDPYGLVETGPGHPGNRLPRQQTNRLWRHRVPE